MPINSCSIVSQVPLEVVEEISCGMSFYGERPQNNNSVGKCRKKGIGIRTCTKLILGVLA